MLSLHRLNNFSFRLYNNVYKTQPNHKKFTTLQKLVTLIISQAANVPQLDHEHQYVNRN